MRARGSPRGHEGRHQGRLASRRDLVDGLRVHARVSAEQVPEGRLPVVLVHGQVVSSRYMGPLARHLAPHHPVLAPDLPGYGRSDKPLHAPTLPEAADLLARWMDAIGLARAALVGNSYGCQIVAEAAVRHPERVARAALLGPTADPHARTFRQQTARWAVNGLREPPSLSLVLARDYADAGLRRSVETVRQMLGDRMEEKLPRVRAPTLVVRGGRDPIVPQGWAEEATRLLPRGRLVVIPGAPHTLNYTAPLETARVLLPFFAERVTEEGGAEAEAEAAGEAAAAKGGERASATR